MPSASFTPIRFVAALCATIALVAAAPASAVTPARQPVTALGSLVPLAGTRGCVADRSSPARGCAPVRALAGPAPFLGSQAVAISPDGQNVYVASSGSNAIAVFRRSPLTGALTQAPGRAGCVAVGGADGCAHGIGLHGPNSVAVSPDGRSVYATSLKSSAVTAFRRDPATGALTQVGCVSGSPVTGCTAGRALTGPDVVAVSPDGRNVYVGAFLGSALAVFTRNPSTGTLKQPGGDAGCVVEKAVPGCGDGVALGAPEGLAVSRDGKTVYVAAAASNALDVFSRNSSTGALTQASGAAGCIVDQGLAGCTTGVQLAGANAVAVSPDDESVYVTSLLSNSVTAFSRASSGRLGQLSGTSACVINLLAVGCSLGRQLSAPEGLAVSPDGASLYVTAFTSGALDVLDRSGATGAVLQKPRRPGCIALTPSPDCSRGRALAGVSSVAVSPDGQYVYAAAFASDAVTAYRRVGPPTPPPGRG